MRIAAQELAEIGVVLTLFLGLTFVAHVVPYLLRKRIFRFEQDLHRMTEETYHAVFGWLVAGTLVAGTSGIGVNLMTSGGGSVPLLGWILFWAAVLAAAWYGATIVRQLSTDNTVARLSRPDRIGLVRRAAAALERRVLAYREQPSLPVQRSLVADADRLDEIAAAMCGTADEMRLTSWLVTRWRIWGTIVWGAGSVTTGAMAAVLVESRNHLGARQLVATGILTVIALTLCSATTLIVFRHRRWVARAAAAEIAEKASRARDAIFGAAGAVPTCVTVWARWPPAPPAASRADPVAKRTCEPAERERDERAGLL